MKETRKKKPRYCKGKNRKEKWRNKKEEIQEEEEEEKEDKVEEEEVKEEKEDKEEKEEKDEERLYFFTIDLHCIYTCTTVYKADTCR